VYINTQDLTLWVQVCTEGGKLETFVSRSSMSSLQGPVVIAIVVDVTSIQLYFNEQPQLAGTRKLTGLSKIIKPGSVMSGNFKKMTARSKESEDTSVADGVLTLLRITQRAYTPHEVASCMRATKHEAALVLQTRKERQQKLAASGVEKRQHELEKMPDSVHNVIEVTNVLLQFMRVQYVDDPAVRRQKKLKGDNDLSEPCTTMLTMVNCANCAAYLPHRHPKYLDLLRIPLKRAVFIAGLIVDNFRHCNERAGVPVDQVLPPDHSVLVVCTTFFSSLIDSPRARNVMLDDAAAILVVKLIPLSGVQINLSDYTLRNTRNMRTQLGVLLLHARQSFQTIALIMDTLFHRMLDSRGLIYKEELQEFLLGRGLEALDNIMEQAAFAMQELQQDRAELDERERHGGAGSEQGTSKESDAGDIGGQLLNADDLKDDHRCRVEDEIVAVSHVQARCTKMLTHLFLQLHHSMDKLSRDCQWIRSMLHP
jgi:hypothetical protein